MDTLVVGPWAGSLLTELICWQGFARKQSRSFDEVIVVTDDNRKSIYSDFATRLITPNNYDAVMDLTAFGNVTYLTKNDMHVEWVDHQPVVGDQEFVKLGGFSKHTKYAALIDSPDYSHLSLKEWAEFVCGLDIGLDVAWVSDELSCGMSYYGTDLRGCSFDSLLSAVTDAEVVIGPSGSTVLLAALCGVPFVTWVDRSVCNLYRDVWNPLNTVGSAFTGKPTVSLLKEQTTRISKIAGSYAATKVNSHE